VSPLGFAAHRDALSQGRFVRVLNFHNTAETSRDSVRADLLGLRETFAGVTLDELDGFFATGTWSDDRPAVIPVFYEGYRNNAEVAGPVCDELGLTAWFFICTGFVDCPPAEQEQFARSHNIDLLPAEFGRDRVAMTWDQVADLSRRHVVTPHTASHDGIADIVTDEDLEREIVQPKRRMDAVTGQSAPAMAYLWGSPFGGSPRHDDAVRAAGYRYLFSNTMIQQVS
jgi:peptidoglycan/xylan/chitin deacetylase (PgdA/CDA1 family)